VVRFVATAIAGAIVVSITCPAGSRIAPRAVELRTAECRLAMDLECFGNPL
jgi:hypothetical protein